jgi:predicted ATP-grasp superfamily ATP-dependent carboligase
MEQALVQRPRAGRPIAAVLCGDLNMLRCLVGQQISTVVVSSDPEEVTLRSRYCERAELVAPPDDNERCVADLERIARALGRRPVLYYGTDAMLLSVSRQRERLEPLFRFRMPSSELVETLVDKIRFAELATRVAIPTPETAVSSEAATAEAIARRVPFPCVIKPSVHIGWLHARAASRKRVQKAVRADNLAELRELIAEVREHTDRFVVQRFIPGGEDQIYSFHAYADADARIVGCFAGKKIRTYPREAGVSTFVELVKEPAVIRLGRQIVERLGLVGPVKIDFKRDAASGAFHVLELNPRFTL